MSAVADKLVEFIADELAQRLATRIDEEFRGFWAREDLVEAIPELIREEARRVVLRGETA